MNDIITFLLPENYTTLEYDSFGNISSLESDAPPIADEEGRTPSITYPIRHMSYDNKVLTFDIATSFKVPLPTIETDSKNHVIIMKLPIGDGMYSKTIKGKAFGFKVK